MSLDEEIDARKIRQLWVEDAMKKREHEFTDLQNVTIFNGTYNVNSKKEDGDLRDWLFPHQNSGLKTADIYAIGFQEIVDLNAVNVAVDGSKTSSRAQYWEEKLNEALNIWLKYNKTGNLLIKLNQSHVKIRGQINRSEPFTKNYLTKYLNSIYLGHVHGSV